VKTLSIGDGANDVAMIQEAHIGVGLYGKEGSQSARSSDYSLHRFRHLTRLLMYQGRYSMLRSEQLIYFGFYKNVSMIGANVWFAIYNAYSGQTLYDDYILAVYNVIIVGLPPFVLGLGEKDLGERMIKKYPEAYQELKNIYLNWRTFAIWMLTAIYQSIIFFYLPYYMWMGNDVFYSQGYSGEFWLWSTASSIPAVFSILLRYGLISNRWTVVTIIALFGSFVAFLIQLYIESSAGLAWPTMSMVLQNTFSSATFWCQFFLTPVASLLPNFLISYAQRQFSPHMWQILQEHDVLKKKKKG